MKFSKRLAVLAMLAISCFMLSGTNLSAAVGDLVTVITVPVPSPTNIGVSVAVDCFGVIYYTNYQSPYLHKCDKLGNQIGSPILMTDATGAPATIGEMVWDRDRAILWGGSDSQYPLKIYQVNPTTGLVTFMFNGQPGYDLTDGIAYDSERNEVLHSPDVSTDVWAMNATTGALDRIITPLDGGGNPMGAISGITVGTNDVLYCGRNGYGQIVRVNKFNGAFIDVFASPAGRDEGLECDPINFWPRLVMWSKEAYNNQITAFEVYPQSCNCGGVTPSQGTTWGAVKALYR